MNKKAAELTLNVIIIAVLVLMVLVVLLFIFSGRINLFGKGLKNCESLGGKCYSEGDSANVDTVEWDSDGKATKINCKKGTPIYGTSCETNKNVCCMQIG